MTGEFLDTNILVYAFDRTAGEKRSIASQLLLELFDSGRGRLSTQVMMEFFVTVTRKLPRPLSLAATNNISEDFGTWPVFRPHPTDIVGAGKIAARYGISFWDGMIVRAAEALSVTMIWTEELNDGQRYQGIRVRNPFSG